MKELNSDTLNDFYQVIKRGDKEHKEWLAKVIEDYFDVEIKRDEEND